MMLHHHLLRARALHLLHQAKVNGGCYPFCSSAPPNFLVDSTYGAAVNIVLEDNSRSYGGVVTEVDQKVSGSMIGLSLRACTGLVADIQNVCTKLEEFTTIASNWNNASGPTGFFTVGNVTALQWPHGAYFNRYLAPDGSHVTRTWTPTISQEPNFLVDSVSGTAVSIQLVDNSKGTGSGLNVDQKAYNGGERLRACTATIQNLRSACLKESDFVELKGASGSGLNIIYSTVGTVQWPFVTYFNRYLAADGSHVTRKWSPTGIGTSNGWQ